MHPDHKQTQINETPWRLPRSEVTCRGAGGRRGGRHSRGRAPAACCTTPSSPPGHHHHHHHYHHHHHHHYHHHYLVTLSPAPRGTLSRTCWNPSSVGWAQPNIGNPGTWDGISVNRGQHSSVSGLRYRQNKSSVINNMINIMLHMYMYKIKHVLVLHDDARLFKTVV